MSYTSSEPSSPLLSWDTGTAYDLFLSQEVLHKPEKFGLRASWAAGVRSRLPAESRRTLEDAIRVLRVPFHWLHSLPAPRNASVVLRHLADIPPEQRLSMLATFPNATDSLLDLLQSISASRAWTDQDRIRLRELLPADPHSKALRKEKDLAEMLDVWARAAEFGGRYLDALHAYYQVFFAEEELRIEPYLIQAQVQAQELALQTTLPQLLETLSQGLYLPDLLTVPQLVLIPSFWVTPLVYLGDINPNCKVMVFGARPAGESLVPGETVPDALLQVLKAMADPTRLRILRYLSSEQLTQAELSRRLRLRAPTLTHHLSALRLAGLVHITVEAQAERHYSARLEAVHSMSALLEQYLNNKLEGNNAQNKSD